MNWISVSAGMLVGIYGLLNGLTGWRQRSAGRIQPWAAWVMLACGLALLVCAGGIFTGQGWSTGLLVAGLIGLHAITLHNGLHLHRRINPSHHLLRLAVSLVLIGMAYGSLLSS